MDIVHCPAISRKDTFLPNSYIPIKWDLGTRIDIRYYPRQQDEIDIFSTYTILSVNSTSFSITLVLVKTKTYSVIYIHHVTFL